MLNSKSNYVIVILVAFVFSCKNSIDNTQKATNKNIEISEGTNINQSKPDFSYTDLEGKTFLPVHQEEDGTYQYLGDISKEYDMGEDRIRFKKNIIKHLIPIEWQSRHILSKNINNGWLQLNLVGNLSDIEDERTHFSYYFKYDKNKNLLFHSRHLESDHLEIFMDSAFIAKKERLIVKNENPLKKYVVNKKSKILIGNKSIEIELPFINEYIDEYGEKRFGKSQIPNQIEAKLLKGSKGEILYLFGEERCGPCPSFSAIYKLNGENLTYRYTRRKGQEMIVLLSKEEESEILKNYGFVDNEFLIQFNHVDTPTYIIKDWY